MRSPAIVLSPTSNLKGGVSMNILPLPLGEYQTNCYLVSDEHGDAAVIDPGYTPELVLSRASAEGLTVRAVLLTHGHFDHVGGVKAIAAATGSPVWLHENDLVLPEQLTAGPLYYTDTYDKDATIQIGRLTFTVLETPGHTPGSVCLRCGHALFSGDTLFASSCGRVDLFGGNGQQMLHSLQKLAQIPENLRVLPGHGPETTLDWERAHNPYLREALR